MFKSLRSRIMLVVGGVVFLTAGTISVFSQRGIEQAVFNAEEQHALDLMHAVLLNVENEYKSLLFHKEATLERRKSELKNIVALALTHIDQSYREFEAGIHSEEEAKAQAISGIKELRYDEGVGYIWVNDMGRPVPSMVVHPTLPELDGKVLDDPIFNSALGVGKNLFVAAVDICLKDGEGYVDYLWPKPTREGLTADQPKLSYVRLFEAWRWVIGTGVYIDDIEEEARRRLEAVVAELNHTFDKVRVAETGYMFVFNGKRQMLIHPNIEGEELIGLKDPATGNFLVDELIEASNTPAEPFDYIWDKPEHKGDFRYRKRAYVTYFEPLDWYIASTMYIDEIAQHGKRLRERVVYLTVLSLAAAFIFSILLSRSLTKPLGQLTKAAKGIEKKGVAEARIPVCGTAETRKLGSVLDQMVRSIRQVMGEKEEVMSALAESNEELVKSNDRLGEEVVERKAAEEALRKSEGRLKAIFNNVGAGIVIIDQAGRFVEVNDRFTEMFGYSREEVLGKTPLDLTHPEDREKSRRVLEAGTGGGLDTYRLEKRYLRKDGGVFWGELISTKALGPAGEVEADIGIVFDISARIDLEEQLKETNRDLEAFVYTASHDLRAPLAPIIGYAEILKEMYGERLGEQALDFLAEIESQGEKMLALMEDLLTLAKVGHLERPVEPVEAGEVVREVVENLASRVAESGAAVTQGPLPEIRVPRSLLAQVFDNLIGNALRYAGGAIEVGGERKGEKVRFFVRDHGPGIQEQERARVFEVFYRGGPGKDVEGTGVGLATVAKVARIYGGRAWVEETPGGGSTFWVEMEDGPPKG